MKWGWGSLWDFYIMGGGGIIIIIGLREISNMKIRLYMDYLSQPSRAVYCFFLITKTPHEIHETRVTRQDNKTPEYLKLNPLGTVPCIYDPSNNLALTESHTIMRYLCWKHPEAAKDWYPASDYKKISQVD